MGREDLCQVAKDGIRMQQCRRVLGVVIFPRFSGASPSPRLTKRLLYFRSFHHYLQSTSTFVVVALCGAYRVCNTLITLAAPGRVSPPTHCSFFLCT